MTTEDFLAILNTDKPYDDFKVLSTQKVGELTRVSIDVSSELKVAVSKGVKGKKSEYFDDELCSPFRHSFYRLSKAGVLPSDFYKKVEVYHMPNVWHTVYVDF